LSDQPEPTDRRAARRKEERRLFWAVVVFLVVGGAVAIGVAYGPRAVALGLACLVLGAGTLVVLWLILSLVERISR